MKIKNLYNLDSFKRFLDAEGVKKFKDAAAGVVLERNLTQVDPRIFQKLYPELAFMNSGITIDNTGGYARKIQSLRIREQGGFTTSGDENSDKGKITLAGEQSFLNVLVREAMSIWTDDDIKEADMQGINIVSKFIESHNKIYQREIDQIGFLGIPDVVDSLGLLNYNGFVSGAASGAIGTLTAQQMYDEVASFITDQWGAVNNTPGYMADNVILPVTVFNTLNSTQMDTASGTRNIMGALRDNFPTVRFSATFRAESVSAVSVCVAFSSNEEVMKMRIPVPLTVGEIVKSGSFDFKVDSKYRVAGLDVLEDAGGRILTGL